MLLDNWKIDKKDIGYSSRLEKAKSAALTPLGFRPEIGYAVFSGRHGIYNTTLDHCNCFDCASGATCKHIIRLAMEMGLIDEPYESDISQVKYPQEPSFVTKKVFIDTNTGEIFDEQPLPKGPLSQKTFVVTGIFDDYSRKEITSIINQAGGKVASSVSNRTTYLVVGSDPGEAKLARAKQIGIKTISEKELIALIEKNKVQE